jgi:hypothetical protein
MIKLSLLTIMIMLSGCFEEKPDATYPNNHPQGAIITEEGTVIFYHEMWDNFATMMYNL